MTAEELWKCCRKEKKITDTEYDAWAFGDDADGLAELVKKVVGFEGKIVLDASKPDGTMRKLTDISRIKALGWEPKITLEAGLKETYQWFRDKYESGDFAVR